MKSWVHALVLFCFAAALGLGMPAGAQEPPFPHKGAIEITVLFPAGSSADVTARLLAEGMAKQLAANVIVVNRPGAGGAIGYKYVASQKSDGYTLVWNSNSVSTTYHSGMMAIDFHAFDPVARALSETPILVVRGDSKWKTLADMIADAKARPKQITVGHSGVGSHTHISGAALFKAAGIEVTEVPFAAAQVVPSLMGGHVDALVQLPAALASHMKSGSVRVIAALAQKRDPTMPEAPTALEQGVDATMEAWRGIAVPKGTPKPVIAALEAAVRKTVESPEFAQASARLGVRPAFLPADEFGELIAAEDASLAKLMQAIGLKKSP